jgi:lipopolysaccharide biosynthesis regulator YciM
VRALDLHCGELAFHFLAQEASTAEVQLCRARAAVVDHTPAAAMPFLGELLESNIKDVRALEMLGHVHYLTGEHKEAMEALMKALHYSEYNCPVQVGDNCEREKTTLLVPGGLFTV